MIHIIFKKIKVFVFYLVDSYYLNFGCMVLVCQQLATV